MLPADPMKRSPDHAPPTGVAAVFERLIAGGGYLFAGVGIALCGGLVVSAALQPDLIAYLLRWVIESGWGRVVAIVAAVVTVGVGAAIGRRLAQGRGL